MDINWELYKVFYYVCKFKNLTKVANYFNISQPAITKKIRNLEEQLGINLIVSNNRGIEITEDGMKLFDSIKEQCEGFNELESKFESKDTEKSLKVSAEYIIIKEALFPATLKFNKKNSNVRINIESFSIKESEKRLKSGEVDMFFFMHDILEKDDDVVVKECYKIKNKFITSAKMKNFFPDKISVYDLNKYPLIAKEKGEENRDILQKMLDEKGIELEPKYELSSYWTIRNYIDTNKGFAFLDTGYVKDELEEGKYIIIPTIEEIPEVTVYCAYLKNSVKKPIIKEFLEFVPQGTEHFDTL